MKNEIVKTYELEEILDTYINKNGISELLNKHDKVNNDKENKSLIIQSDEEYIDKQIEKDFLDDVDIPANETEEAHYKRVKRYPKIVKLLKQKYGFKCQLCGYSFRMSDGNGYCEAHHIKMLSKDGSQSPENVIILCANHHRLFHYSIDEIIIGKLIDGKRIIKIGEKEFKVQFQLMKGSC